jgi:hypothetical protein
MLGKFIAGDFIAIACEMCRFPASNENTEYGSFPGYEFSKHGLYVQK